MHFRLIAAALLVLLMVTPAPVALAQGAPPPLPALCYGELTVDGNPAPVGTKVVAKVDGVVRGELVSEEVGWYGGPGLKSKLAVGGEMHTGKMIRFYVSGTYNGTSYGDVFAWEELYWGSGEVMQINLGVKDIEGTADADPPAVPVPNPLPAPVDEPEPYPELAENAENQEEADELESDENGAAEAAGSDEAEADEAASEAELETGSLSTGWTIAAVVLLAGVIATLVISNRIRKRTKRAEAGSED